MNQKEISLILDKALEKTLLENEVKLSITEDLNVLDCIDSFSIVNLLLEIEMGLEKELGKYISIADENLFDGQSSPLLKWEEFKLHVCNLYDES